MTGADQMISSSSRNFKISLLPQIMACIWNNTRPAGNSLFKGSAG